MNWLQSAQWSGAILPGLGNACPPLLGWGGGWAGGSGLSFVFLAILLHVYLFGTGKPPLTPRAFYQVLLN